MIIALKEIKSNEDTICLEIFINKKGLGKVDIVNPLENVYSKSFEWYFDKYKYQPYEVRSKINIIKESLKNYGEFLFKKLFYEIAQKEALNLIRSSNKLNIEVEGNSNWFQGLYWELLKDPESDSFLCLENRSIIRINDNKKTSNPLLKVSQGLNVLIISSRPSRNDIDYRIIQKPLVEAIDYSKLNVTIEILRPPTFIALKTKLEEKPIGYYSIIHFDVHGVIKNYNSIRQLSLTKNYDISYVEPFSGLEAFLLFNSEQNLGPTPIVSSLIADLFNKHETPLCVLNACNSGKQIYDSEDETSLGFALVKSGIQSVIGMRHTLTIKGAEIFIFELYSYLLNGYSIRESVDYARVKLYESKWRDASLGYEIQLEDWCLPTLFQDKLVVSIEESKTLKLTQHNVERFHNKITGVLLEKIFVGRDKEIMELEKMLGFTNLVLVYGTLGCGKTKLFEHLADWWERTSFFKNILIINIKKIIDTSLEEKEVALFWKTINKLIKESNRGGVNELIILDQIEYYTLFFNNSAIHYLKVNLERLIKQGFKVIMSSQFLDNRILINKEEDLTYELEGLNSKDSILLIKTITNAQAGSFLYLKDYFEVKQIIKASAGLPIILRNVSTTFVEKTGNSITENKKLLLNKKLFEETVKKNFRKTARKLEFPEIHNFLQENKINNNELFWKIQNCLNLAKIHTEDILFLTPFQGKFIVNILFRDKYYSLFEIDSKNSQENSLTKKLEKLKQQGLIKIEELDAENLVVEINPLLPYICKFYLIENNPELIQRIYSRFSNYYDEYALNCHKYYIATKK